MGGMGDGDGAQIRQQLDKAGLRRQQVALLMDFDQLCNELGLTYYLWGGTLLGAMKFEGYIPWDDDVDLAMPRWDYEQLCRNAARLPEALALLTPHSTPGHFLPYLKLGLRQSLLIDHTSRDLRTMINIDIFPLDGAPPGLKGRARRELTYLLVRFLRTSMYPLETGWRRYVRLVARLLLQRSRLRQVVARLIDRCARHPDSDASHLRMAVWARGTPIARSAIEPAQLRRFEGRLYPTPRDPVPLLRLVYGDWESTPPALGRGTSHRFEAYLLPPDPAA